MGSTFDIRTFLGDFTILNLDHIHAEYMTLLAVWLDPMITPAHACLPATGEGFSKFKDSRWRCPKERFEASPDCSLASEILTIRCRVGVLENAILSHESHEFIHGMPVEGGIEALDDLEGRGGIRLCGTHLRLQNIELADNLHRITQSGEDRTVSGLCQIDGTPNPFWLIFLPVIR
jgi:hypothetical protein